VVGFFSIEQTFAIQNNLRAAIIHSAGVKSAVKTACVAARLLCRQSVFCEFWRLWMWRVYGEDVSIRLVTLLRANRSQAKVALLAYGRTVLRTGTTLVINIFAYAVISGNKAANKHGSKMLAKTKKSVDTIISRNNALVAALGFRACSLWFVCAAQTVRAATRGSILKTHLATYLSVRFMTPRRRGVINVRCCFGEFSLLGERCCLLPRARLPLPHRALC